MLSKETHHLQRKEDAQVASFGSSEPPAEPAGAGARKDATRSDVQCGV
jgi:hypothetical protein